MDFEFMKSDGVTSGSVARVKAEFTNKLDLMDDFGEAIKPKKNSILKCEECPETWHFIVRFGKMETVTVCADPRGQADKF